MRNNIVEYLKSGFVYDLYRYARVQFEKIFIDKCFKNYYLNDDIEIEEVLIKELKHTFGGYYNYSPINKKNEVIVCGTNTSKKRGSNFDTLKIYKYNLDSRAYSLISQTNCWNWQQGCLAQWLNDDEIIYNIYDEENDCYSAEIVNVQSKSKRRLSRSIYAVKPDCNFALGLNFSRLANMRPDYGYFNIKNNVQLSDKEDGVWLINIRKNTSKLIISLSDLKKFESQESMNDATHKVNHIDISPSKDRFAFLHRWFCGNRKYTRLLSCDLSGNDLKYHKGNEFVSHSCWDGNEGFVSFCKYDGLNTGYVEIKDLGRTFNVISDPLLFVDGHPSISPNGSYMLTDTANPIRGGYKKLFLKGRKGAQECIELGKFFHPSKFFGETRVDLHPQWDLEGNVIFIDSGHNGRRRLYCLKLKKHVS